MTNGQTSACLWSAVRAPFLAFQVFCKELELLEFISRSRRITSSLNLTCVWLKIPSYLPPQLLLLALLSFWLIEWKYVWVIFPYVPHLSLPLTLTCSVYTQVHVPARNNVHKCCYHTPGFIQALQKAQDPQIDNCRSNPCHSQTNEPDSRVHYVIQLCKHQTTPPSILKHAKHSSTAADPKGESLITTLTKLRPPKLEVINCPWGLSGSDSTRTWKLRW